MHLLMASNSVPCPPPPAALACRGGLGAGMTSNLEAEDGIMVKDSKAKGAAAKGNWRPGEEASFRLIQPLDMTAIKTAIIKIAGSPDRRIAGSPDRRIAGSPDRPSCVWMVSPFRAILIPA